MAYSPGPYKPVSVEGGWDGVECERDGLLCRLAYNNPDNADLFAAAPALAEVARHARTLCAAVLATGHSLSPAGEPCCMTCDLYHETDAALALLD